MPTSNQHTILQLNFSSPSPHLNPVAVLPPCPVCSSRSVRGVFNLVEMPVFVGVQWPSAAEARHCLKGDLRLTFCLDCGFFWNRSFDPRKVEYSPQYDNSLDYSTVFQQYAKGVVSRLISTYDIHNKSVLEIGCGKGRFLAMLCEEGNNHGTGFDPSYDGERWPSPASDRIVYVRDLYSERHASCQADLICCRFVFEHVPRPLDFMRMLRRAVKDKTDTIIYFEVPDVALLLEALSPWEVIYEHCSYFGRESLARVFEEAGFEILQLQETFDGQFIGIDARPSSEDRPPIANGRGDPRDLQRSIDDFRKGVSAVLEKWHRQIDAWTRAHCKVAAWGAGARAVSFLNICKVAEVIPFVVDINPHKQGLHLAGTGQLIVAPQFLTEYRPDVVLLMNPIYRREVEEHLATLGLSPELVSAF